MTRPENKTRLARLFAVTVIAIAGMVILTGCPYHSTHQTDEIPMNPVESSYFGKWRGMIADEVTGEKTDVRLNIGQFSENEYNLEFIGYFLKRTDRKKRPLTDTISTTGFISNVDNKLIFNIRYGDQVYLADFYYVNDQISLLPLSDHFTSFMIRSNKQLRNVISYHFKSRINPLYDESTCLKNMTRITE